ncbi:protein LST8 homolog [Bradysia coprophila]|uniref:protein LST8 homolog n=1 Tax=Bradysia coprophila TaxID=38358 RepID=UPI00187DC3C8|nr:protein LST8 homolog [Bradysia coprophila]
MSYPHEEKDQLLLATGGYDHTIKIWLADTGKCVRTISHSDSQINALDITSDKKILASCGYQHIRLYDLTTNMPLVNFERVSKNVNRVGFQEDGKWMYTGGEDCRVRLWEMNSQNCKRVFDCQTPVNAVVLHPNEVEMAIGSQNGCIYLWDINSDLHEQLFPENDASIQDIAISPDGMYLASVNNKGNCYIWSLSSTKDGRLSNLQPKLKIEAHKRYALRCKFSPDSQYLVTTAGDSTAKVWRTSDFKLVCELKDAENARYWIWDTAFSADSKYLFTASSVGKATLWKIAEKKVEREYYGHQKAVTALAFRE